MKLFLIGARKDGQAHLVLDLLRETGAHEVIAFIDETPGLAGTSVHGIPVLGPPTEIERAVRMGAAGGMVSIGNPVARERLGHVILAARLELPTLIHPRAYVAPSARIGRGVFIGAMAVVSSGAVVDDLALICPTAFVSHHVHLGSSAGLSPRATTGGRSRVGRRAFLGLGSIVLPDRAVGDDAVVGAGSVVNCDVPPATTVVGVPARALQR